MREKEFRLPDLGEGLTDAELLSWSVAVGDVVALNQVIAEVETAKATVELPSPFSGTVAALLVTPGDTVPVGAPLIRITTDDDAPAETSSVLVGYGPAASEPSRRARRTPLDAPPPVTEHASASPAAKPGARRAARELGVDLAAVPGTGPDGVITAADVEALATSSGADLRESRTPVRGVRKRTADAMVRSAFTAPHATAYLTADVTESMALLDRLRETPGFDGIAVTPLTITAKALLIALRDHPDLNSTWDEARGEIVVHRYVHLGIAVATDHGLLVPTVKDAHTLSLPELARAIGGAADTARSGAATPAELTGGTVTITNIGVFGVDAGAPILVPGQAAILCLGQVARRPWVVGDAVVPRWVETLGLTVDHRVADGATAARCLAAVCEILTDPLTLLAHT